MTGAGIAVRAVAVAAFAAAFAPSAPAHAASAWAVDAARSRLLFTATQAGGEFDGQFKRFEADIAFDPADLATSRFRVVIQTAAADTGDPDRDTALRGPDFFASERWATATYEATRFAPASGGQFVASGRLTIRGVARDVPVTFTFKPAADGRSATLTGGATIRRLDFGVGQGEWQDTQWVGNDVRIRFDLLLHRK